ncbi:MAG: type II secretion system protein [Clostridiales bacterium]|nr:type II secretion system protein [Clostridiales bacterium]
MNIKKQKQGFTLLECILSAIMLMSITVGVIYLSRSQLKINAQRDTVISTYEYLSSVLESARAKVKNKDDLYVFIKELETDTELEVALYKVGQGKCELNDIDKSIECTEDSEAGVFSDGIYDQSINNMYRIDLSKAESHMSEILYLHE